jgi:hypothetical protein
MQNPGGHSRIPRIEFFPMKLGGEKAALILGVAMRTLVFLSVSF